MLTRPLAAGLACVLVGPAAVGAEEADAAGRAYFETHIRPVLVAHCLDCHGADAEPPGGNLRLDLRAGWGTGRRLRPRPRPRRGDARRADAGAAVRIQRDAPGRQVAGRSHRQIRAVDRRRGRRPPRRHARPPGGEGLRRRRPGRLGLHPADPRTRPRRGGRRVAEDRGGPLPAGEDGGRRPRPRPGRRPRRRVSPAALRPRRAAAGPGGPRGVRRRPDRRALGGGGRPAARLAPVRPGLGPALAGRGPLRGLQRQRLQRHLAGRLAVPRLRRGQLQRRRAVRPLPHRTARRRPAAGRHRRGPHPADGGDGVPRPRHEDAERAGQGKVRPRRGGRADRRGRPGDAGADAGVCAVPRPQVRPRPRPRLLRAGRHLHLHEAARGGNHPVRLRLRPRPPARRPRREGRPRAARGGGGAGDRAARGGESGPGSRRPRPRRRRRAGR